MITPFLMTSPRTFFSLKNSFNILISSINTPLNSILSHNQMINVKGSPELQRPEGTETLSYDSVKLLVSVAMTV